MRPEEYDAHMAHPHVMQTQALSRIMKEQFALVPEEARPHATIAILGVANGNGLEHVIPCNIGQIIGVDINEAFLSACEGRYPELKDRMRLYVLDLSVEAEKAAAILSSCDLMIANLLIEHVHRDRFEKVIKGMRRCGQILSCVIQINPDGVIVSHSGAEHAFMEIVRVEEQESIPAVDTLTENSGYHKTGQKEYELPNGKRFVRLDYIAK
jgi:hypothetical protein